MAHDGIGVGDKAPRFKETLVHPGGYVEDVGLSRLLEDKPVLLCFHTNDFTPTPDRIDEWYPFLDYNWFVSENRVKVVGVGKLSPETHREFIERYELEFPFYSDTDLEVSESFGVKDGTLNLFARSRLSCFLIDRNRRVRYRWVAGEKREDEDAAEEVPSVDAQRSSVPPAHEIYEDIVSSLDMSRERQTFGFGQSQI